MDEEILNKNSKEGSSTNDTSKKTNSLKSEIKIQNKNLIGKELFKKYLVKKKIGEGSQSTIYSGQNIQTKENVAIKTEKRTVKDCLLQKEIYTLFRLKKNIGFPNLITCGRSGENLVLIETLLGKSLDVLFLDLSKKFTLFDICQIAIQCLDRIELIHTKGILHCDIKPENFSIGLKDPNVIYLIDFGLSQNYKSLKTGKHIDFSFTGYMTGTARYASRHALRGKQLSRRDDMESFIYMILYFMAKELPWMGKRAKNMAEKYRKIYTIKKNFKFKEFCKAKKCPEEMINIIDYIFSLSFKEKPNYEYIRGLFKRILENKNLYKKNTFSWIKDMKSIEIKREKANSETKIKVAHQKKRIHNSILQFSINGCLKESTIAVANLKLSKIKLNESKINLGESTATVYDNENNGNNGGKLNTINEVKEEENSIDKSKEEDINEEENTHNLFSTGANSKADLVKFPDDEEEKKKGIRSYKRSR